MDAGIVCRPASGAHSSEGSAGNSGRSTRSVSIGPNGLAFTDLIRNRS
jgi:hypothetical protein